MEIDKADMRQVILDSSKQLADGWQLAESVTLKGDFKNVIVCGIGGSALPVDVINTALRTKAPILINRDYDLPEEADKDSLIICISYSGNTEEVISAFQEALRNNFSVFCITSGGKMEAACKEQGIPLVKIPPGIQPRSATGYMVGALAKILGDLAIIDDISKEIQHTVKALDAYQKEAEQDGRELAKKLRGKFPIVYSSDNFKDIARIWKIKFNENAKVPSFYNYFPELNHNEMVGFSQSRKDNPFSFVIMRDGSDHPRNLKRMDLFVSLLKERGSESFFIDMKEGSLLFKTFSTLLLGDWVSYYLALEQKIDPSPVAMVEEFKKLMEA